MFNFIKQIFKSLKSQQASAAVQPMTQRDLEVENTFQQYSEGEYGIMGTTSYLQTLSVMGPRQRLEEFRKFVGGYDADFGGRDNMDIVKEYSHFCFASIIPFQATDVQHVTWSNLVKARLRRWDVPTNAFSVELTERDLNLIYSFATLLALPKPIYVELIKRYPDLKFKLEWTNFRKGLLGKMVSRNCQAHFWQKDKFVRNRKVE